MVTGAAGTSGRRSIPGSRGAELLGRPRAHAQWGADHLLAMMRNRE
jgi:hypothetical protein